MVRKLFTVAALLTGLLLSSPSQAATPVGTPVMSYCDVFSPNFEVVPVFNKPAMDHSLGTSDMFSPESPLGDNIGHESGKAKIRATPVFGLASEGNESCIFMEEVTVVFSIDATIRIPNEYPDGSCEYKQIVEHENKHMAATKDFTTQVIPSLKAYLDQQMNGQGGTGLARRRQEEAQIYLQQQLDRKIANYARFINDEYRKMHQNVIDSPEEMKKVYAACPNGWKRRID